ncbi:hypothetical protein N781_10960 [Pontibacillus halophilus JSM 076056 = DSM 19796]|uniref:DUF1510 domain-containing protein n=1 Tax=Pontibacillus halophilus JSM 076056 = DSM 19796 TaxID=1385510 RepID=A0A0A5ICJ5_9BACI|nr:YrrS family protein [Pontibacillus halophilus]KGX93542.1 hypothetical protein N781_10960 [Pontibacillus halophilus JSM 076056 = DSM 19796]
MQSNRVNRYEKQRKVTQRTTMFSITGAVLLVVLIGVFVFNLGGEPGQAAKEANSTSQENKEATEESKQEETEKSDDKASDQQSEEESASTNEEDSVEQEEQTGERITLEESSDDPNVVTAYTKNWEPVGTEQTGEHVTKFEKGTEEWAEMNLAISKALNLNEGQYVLWWITRGDDKQSFKATVSDSAETDTYRVYGSWVANEGWQPTKVEVLKENDKK